MIKRLTLLSLNYYEGLNYVLKIIFAHLFLNSFFYVKHIITFIPLELFISFTGLTIPLKNLAMVLLPHVLSSQRLQRRF